MGIVRLKPSCKDYIWGGRRLIEEYGKRYDGDILAECWELSCHPAGPSVVDSGPCAGMTLPEYIQKLGKDALGSNCRRFKDFPILIKFIDAKDNLSIQVHPDNRYALQHEGQYGKTEMWYVMDAGPEAFLYYGFKKEISREEFARRIQEDTLLEVLNAVPVHKGDVLFIEAGTIHAIGKDILIAEIQQNSNVTYRVYDYGRVGKDGKKRDLHIEKALAVTNRTPIIKNSGSYPHVADCDYFTVDHVTLDGRMMKTLEGTVSEESFASILVLDGEGTITCRGGSSAVNVAPDGREEAPATEGLTASRGRAAAAGTALSDREESLPYRKGDSLFLTAGSGEYRIEGRIDALITRIREKSAPVRIGIEIGGTHTRIGLVDIHQKLITDLVMPTDPERGAQSVAEEIAARTQQLLDETGICVDQCVGVGVGVAGTVDRINGIVRYSNNIRWENVNLAELFGRLFPIPVRVANNADCAALGELVAGAGKECQDLVLLTLGTGVGSGIILDGEIYEGGRVGGAELGHMVIVENGEPCSCGRKGCLEAYVSAGALKREAARAKIRMLEQDAEKSAVESFKQATRKATTLGTEALVGCADSSLDGSELTAESVFAAAAAGDAAMQAVVDAYVRRLGIGIVNIINIFRPQTVLLGGTLSAQMEPLLKPLKEIAARNCFGGEEGELPDIAIAALGEKAGMIGAANL